MHSIKKLQDNSINAMKFLVMDHSINESFHEFLFPPIVTELEQLICM